MTLANTTVRAGDATRELTIRIIDVRAATIDEGTRSVESVLSTETPVMVYDWNAGLIDEILLADGGQYPEQLPLIDAHDRSSIGNVLGSIRQIHQEGDSWVGRLFFDDGNPSSQTAWSLVKNGHVSDVSIGYRANQFTDIPPGQSATVAGKNYTASNGRGLRITTDYTPREASLVPIGADPNAKIRSNEDIRAGEPISGEGLGIIVMANRQNIPMINAIAAGMCMRAGLPIKDRSIIEQAKEHSRSRLIEICREAIELDTRQRCTTRYPADLVERTLGSGSLQAIFSTVVNAALMAAWEEEPDTTQGWVFERDVHDYKDIQTLGTTLDSRLKVRQRGQVAEQAVGNAWAETYRIFELSRQWEIDDMDIIDDNFHVLLDTPRALGRSAKRAKPDLVYSLLLQNPVLAQDSIALFDATTHKNYASGGSGAGGPLAEDSLTAGIAAIDNQVDVHTDEKLSYGLRAAYLMVPPDLKYTALDLVRKITVATADGTPENLIVRSDARIGTAGVVNPLDNTKRLGTKANWFLAATAGRTVEVAYLDRLGRTPRIRDFKLDGGKWGIGWDIQFAIGAAVADYPGLYMAKGST